MGLIKLKTIIPNGRARGDESPCQDRVLCSVKSFQQHGSSQLKHDVAEGGPLFQEIPRGVYEMARSLGANNGRCPQCWMLIGPASSSARRIMHDLAGSQTLYKEVYGNTLACIGPKASRETTPTAESSRVFY